MYRDYPQALETMLADRIQAATRQIEALTASGRTDESNLKKASRNIYAICAECLRETDGPAAFLGRLSYLQKTWAQARRLALAHDDFARVTTEDAKLAALDDVLTRLNTLKKEVD